MVAPPALEPVEAEVAPAREAPEIRDVPIAKVPPDRTESHDRELPLQLRVLGSEGEELLDSGGTKTATVKLAERLVGLRVIVEVDELGHDLLGAVAIHGEVLGSDVAVLPVVPSGRDHLLEGKAVVDGDWVGGADALCVRQECRAKHLPKGRSILDPPLRCSGIDVSGQLLDDGRSEFRKVSCFDRGSTCHGFPLFRPRRILAYPFIPHHAKIRDLPLVTAFNSFEL